MGTYEAPAVETDSEDNSDWDKNDHAPNTSDSSAQQTGREDFSESQANISPLTIRPKGENSIGNTWGKKKSPPINPPAFLNTPQKRPREEEPSVHQAGIYPLISPPGGEASTDTGWGKKDIDPTAQESANPPQPLSRVEFPAPQANNNTLAAEPRENNGSKSSLTLTLPAAPSAERSWSQEESSALQADTKALMAPKGDNGIDSGFGKMDRTPTAERKEYQPLPWNPVRAGSAVVAQSRQPYAWNEGDDKNDDQNTLSDKMKKILDEILSAVVSKFIESLQGREASQDFLESFIKTRVLAKLQKSSKMAQFKGKDIEAELQRQTPHFAKTTFPHVISRLYPELLAFPADVRVGIHNVAERLARGWVMNSLRSGERIHKSQLLDSPMREARGKDVADTLLQGGYIDNSRLAAVRHSVEQHYDKIADFWFKFAKTRQEQSFNAEDPTDDNDIEYQRRQQQLDIVRTALKRRGTSFDILGLNFDYVKTLPESDFQEELDNAYKGLIFVHSDKINRLNKDKTEKTHQVIQAETEDRNHLMQSINSARDTLKDPMTRQEHINKTTWEAVPDIILNEYNKVEPKIRTLLQTSDQSMIDQILQELDSSNQTILDLVSTNSAYPLDTYRIPMEDFEKLRQVAQTGAQVASLASHFDNMMQICPWLPKQWRDTLFQQPGSTTGNNTTASIPPLVNSNTTTVPPAAQDNSTAGTAYDPNWSKPAQVVTKYDPTWSFDAVGAALSESLNPTFYVPEVSTQVHNSLLKPGLTRAGHRIIGHVPTQKQVRQAQGPFVTVDTARKYFIDVGPKDKNGLPQNPLRWVDDLDEDEGQGYWQNPHTYVMKHMDFQSRPFAEFKCILGIAWQDDYRSGTHLWIKTQDNGQEIITKTAFYQWAKKVAIFRRLLNSFIAQNNVQLPPRLEMSLIPKSQWNWEYNEIDEHYPNDNRYKLRGLQYRPLQPPPLKYQQDYSMQQGGWGYRPMATKLLQPKPPYHSTDAWWPSSPESDYLNLSQRVEQLELNQQRK